MEYFRYFITIKQHFLPNIPEENMRSMINMISAVPTVWLT